MQQRNTDDLVPPSFNIGEILKTIREKGLRGAMDDPRMGPHVHLFVILCIIFLVTIIIMGASLLS
ncbi:hypothetical protein B6U83_01675 [Thermoplasmatales archaeon ex4484_36]|nr:MAG: hypothetical protein B6U83_01675 [Thermoplasmatales archaeon ex4484_36]RLF70272.1 MAG: hypothetical protein DRN35_04575 [Thermoplasmata archaeon]RLF70827.1 MAG: hypothetical protein DRN55_08100 [Thermoplasmata archaeon]HDD59992.1 hypothetical protein [Euryarchaeota archaeon]